MSLASPQRADRGPRCREVITGANAAIEAPFCGLLLRSAKGARRAARKYRNFRLGGGARRPVLRVFLKSMMLRPRRAAAFLFAFFALSAAAQIPTRNATGQFTNPQAQPASYDCAIDGSVVNALTGEPIVRARVTLNGSAPSTAVADSAGNWTLSNVACSSGALTVTRPGFLQQGIRNITLRSGTPVHNFKLELMPQSVIYGKVIDDQGDPLVRIQVAALPSRVVDGSARFQTAGTTVVTNDLGEYRLAGLSRGKYIVCATSVGGPQPDQRALGEVCYPGPVEGGVASAMDIAAGRDTKVDFTMNPARTTRVRGVVSGVPEGRGVGINFVKRASAGIGGNISAPVRDGKFEAQVMPGSYVLSADYFEAGKHLLARLPVEVGSSDIDNITIALDSGFTVTGNARIDSPSAQLPPVKQFGINLRPSEQNNGAGRVQWDTDRPSFALNDMVPGTYRLDFFPPPTFYVKSATLAGQDILNNDFAVSQAAGPIEVVLAADGGSIEGDLVDADGQPATGGVIALRNGKAITGSFMSSQTGNHFKLQNVAPGDYAVYAWDDASIAEYADPEWMKRYGGNGITVTVASGQTAQAKLTVQKIPQ
jgi:Carboxypeptidase regulatory-like domain